MCPVGHGEKQEIKAENTRNGVQRHDFTVTDYVPILSLSMSRKKGAVLYIQGPEFTKKRGGAANKQKILAQV